MNTRQIAELYMVVYYSYIQSGELVLDPASVILESTVELDLWLYDRFTDTLKNESCFKARVYRIESGEPVFVRAVAYP